MKQFIFLTITPLALVALSACAPRQFVQCDIPTNPKDPVVFEQFCEAPTGSITATVHSRDDRVPAMHPIPHPEVPDDEPEGERPDPEPDRATDPEGHKAWKERRREAWHDAHG